MIDDFRFQEYSSEEESEEEFTYWQESPRLAKSFKIRKQKTLIWASPNAVKQKVDKNSILEDLNKKRKRVSHIHITEKKTNYARVNKFYNKSNTLLKTEGRRGKNTLKSTHITQEIIRKGYSKDSSTTGMSPPS